MQDFDGLGVPSLSEWPAPHGIAGESMAQVAADRLSNQLIQIGLSTVEWKFSARRFALLDLGIHADFGAGGVLSAAETIGSESAKSARFWAPAESTKSARTLGNPNEHAGFGEKYPTV